AHLHRDIDGYPFALADGDCGTCVTLESGFFNADSVAAWHEEGQQIVAAAVGDRRVAHPGLGIDGPDRGADNHSLTRIGHAAQKGSPRLLTRQRESGIKKRGHYGPNERRMLHRMTPSSPRANPSYKQTWRRATDSGAHGHSRSVSGPTDL